mmetsp:Transcript_3669/g.5663  ORF Transcript_3669/g.5663 Transcript_3669/m.5663 type:complete len:366 (-) Transcript_3669:485-1582(-)
MARDVDVLPTVTSNADSSLCENQDNRLNKGLDILLSNEYWERLLKRAVYEIALFVASLPHLVPKCFLLRWGAMIFFRNLAYVRHEQGPRLKDLGFDLIPENTDDTLSEIFLFVNTYLTLALVFMPVLASYANDHGMFTMNIFNKIINLLCVGHILRFFTFISTSLPGPAAHCQEGAPLYRHDGFTLHEILTRRSRVHIDPNCGDLIFSGHMFQDTTFCVVMIANLHLLVPHKTLRRLIACMLVVTVIVQPYFIIAARNHYSVDVVVSSYVAPMLWWAMEGFYTTSIYLRCATWWATFCVPKYIQDYLKRHDPTPKCDKHLLSEGLSKELDHLIGTYGIENDDVKQFKDLLLAQLRPSLNGSTRNL